MVNGNEKRSFTEHKESNRKPEYIDWWEKRWMQSHGRLPLFCIKYPTFPSAHSRSCLGKISTFTMMNETKKVATISEHLAYISVMMNPSWYHTLTHTHTQRERVAEHNDVKSPPYRTKERAWNGKALLWICYVDTSYAPILDSAARIEKE